MINVVINYPFKNDEYVADSIRVQTSENGCFEICKDHSALVSALNSGDTLTIFANNKNPIEIFLKDGLLFVSKNVVQIYL